jgi:hypothetical protein
LKRKKDFSLPKVKIYYGVELNCKLGDVLAYGIQLVPYHQIEPEKLIASIRRQKNSIAVCAHPFTNRHEGFGDEVPKEITDKINVKPIFIDTDMSVVLNVQKQLEAPFMLAESESIKSKFLNRLANSHIINMAIRNLLKDIKQERRIKLQINIY